MKTALITTLAASLLGVAFVMGGRDLTAADLTAFVFSMGLVAWTVSQYSRAARPLLVNRPIRFPAPLRTAALTGAAHRLAA